MRTKLSVILLALGACSHSHAPSPQNTVPPGPEFARANGPTVVESTEMSASDSKKPILPDDQIFFAHDSTAIDADGRKLLDEVAMWVSEQPGRHVIIEGHTSTSGTADYNLDLSNRRALAATSYLKSLGVPDERIVVVAMGEQDAHLVPGGVNRRILIFATDDRAAAR